jgi:lysophospholipase L1-like esterase
VRPARAPARQPPVRCFVAVCLFVCSLLGCASHERESASAYEIHLERTPNLPNHARIVFFGDSITEAGSWPRGYVTLVKTSLREQYPDRHLQVIGAGVAGNRVPDLQARLERDVLSKDPTHVVIYIGVNDVASQSASRAPEAIDKDAYGRGLRSLLTRIELTGAEAILCTPGVIGEDPGADSNENRLLDDYALISRQVAAEAGAGLCDLRSAFTEYLTIHNPKRRYHGILTYDGVHLNEEGNRFVARQMLKAFNASQRLPDA